MLHNIAAYVKTKEDGEEIVSWFKSGAWLDYRKKEPDYIQVKIGACDEHLENLKVLNDATLEYNIIRKIDINKTSFQENKG